jgi:putative lipoic acid-binding regulatory protein
MENYMAKPEIEYPCEWSYTIIGSNEEALQEAAQQTFSGKSFSIKVSKKSTAGKYISMNITTSVATEEERNDICRKLSGHPAIKIVI